MKRINGEKSDEWGEREGGRQGVGTREHSAER